MSQRRAIPPSEKLKLWVRAGGRCQICNRYLLEGSIAAREVTFGEMAHIVGQRASERSPRGLEGDVPEDDRDTADNLLLICDDEHDEIDKLGSADAFSVEFLRKLKRRQEDRVFLQTSFAPDRHTCPIRMVGPVRGVEVEVNRQDAAAAVMHGAARFPQFHLSTRNSIEIDLRGLPGEGSDDAAYYRSATAKIDQVVGTKVADGIHTEDIKHISVFAFARLPLLIYLGSRLDDTTPVDVYQRHRSTESWEWPDLEADAAFDVITPETGGKDEAVLVLNISGSIQRHEIPKTLGALPALEIRPRDQTPHRDIISGPNALGAFQDACRSLFAEVEARHKHLRRLHVLAALPVSAAIALGRVHDPAVDPQFLIYDRTADGYREVLHTA